MPAASTASTNLGELAARADECGPARAPPGAPAAAAAVQSPRAARGVAARRAGEGDALRRLLGPRAHGGSRLQDRQARHHAYAPGPSPLRQEPRDLRLQLAALSRAVSENRLDERLKIYTVPRLLIVDEICYLPIDRTSQRRLSPTTKFQNGASPHCCQQ